MVRPWSFFMLQRFHTRPCSRSPKRDQLKNTQGCCTCWFAGGTKARLRYPTAERCQILKAGWKNHGHRTEGLVDLVSLYVGNHVVYLNRPPAVGYVWLVGNRCTHSVFLFIVFFSLDLYCADLMALSAHTCFLEIRWEESEGAWLASASAASSQSPTSYLWDIQGWITASLANVRLTAGSCWSAVNWVLCVQ